MDQIQTVGNKLRRQLRCSMGNADSALLEGMMLGGSSQIEPETLQMFQRCGLSHLLSVSGSHVALLMGLFTGAVQYFRIPRKAVVPFGVLLLSGYAVLCGLRASVCRAVILGAGVLTIIAMPRDAQAFFKKIGVRTNKCKNVMIVGGGQLSYYLAKMLLKSHTEVTIIERDMARCEELVEALPGATIDCGDGTEEELLREEHLESMDGFVACTGMDEVNAILSLYALKHSSKKVITKVNHVDFGDVIEGLQLDSIVNPKQLTAQQIVQYVRAAGNSMESNVETLYRLMNGRVEALEFLLDSKSSLIGTKLADMRIKKNVLIAGIVREGKLIIPGGQDAFQAGDTVIVVTTNLGFHEIENILA